MENKNASQQVSGKKVGLEARRQERGIEMGVKEMKRVARRSPPHTKINAKSKDQRHTSDAGVRRER